MEKNMTSYFKVKPVRDANYLKAVCKDGCVITGGKGYAHHLKGYGQGSAKASDHLTFCLSNEYHVAAYDTGIHANIKEWEKEHGTQIFWIKKTLNKQLKNGTITTNDYNFAIVECDDLDFKYNNQQEQ